MTESFAVRALLGSLVAAALTGLAVAVGLVRSIRGRRLLVLAPVGTAAVAAIASIPEVYLPQLVEAPAVQGATGAFLELLGELQVISTARGLDLVAAAYVLVAGGLLMRRGFGLLAVRRLLGRSTGEVTKGPLSHTFRRLAASMDIRTPRLVLLPDCPGGAFAAGTLRPVVAVDPVLLYTLDPQEFEGLLAHELSHVRRRDTFLCALVGIFRDLTFFLPAVHLAARWLRREQEESADELASRHTKRPVALASGILKVWRSSGGAPAPRMAACAASARVARPRRLTGRRSEGLAREITVRIERLIELAPAPSRMRLTLEVLLAAAVLLVGAGTAISVPTWIANELHAPRLAFGVLAVPTAQQVESPAFATFRHLAPAVPVAESSPLQGARPTEVNRGCPCLETQAQLWLGEAATVPTTPSTLLWRSGTHDPWEMSARTLVASPQARALLTVNETGPRVGFFVVSQ